MITRERAIDVMQRLEEVLSFVESDLADEVHEIGECIYYEGFGEHFWGGDSEEIAKLYTAYRSDLVTQELIDELSGIHRKYEFKASAFEAEEIEGNLAELDQEPDEDDVVILGEDEGDETSEG